MKLFCQTFSKTAPTPPEKPLHLRNQSRSCFWKSRSPAKRSLNHWRHGVPTRHRIFKSRRPKQRWIRNPRSRSSSLVRLVSFFFRLPPSAMLKYGRIIDGHHCQSSRPVRNRRQWQHFAASNSTAPMTDRLVSMLIIFPFLYSCDKISIPIQP